MGISWRGVRGLGQEGSKETTSCGGGDGRRWKCKTDEVLGGLFELGTIMSQVQSQKPQNVYGWLQQGAAPNLGKF